MYLYCILLLQWLLSAFQRISQLINLRMAILFTEFLLQKWRHRKEVSGLVFESLLSGNNQRNRLMYFMSIIASNVKTGHFGKTRSWNFAYVLLRKVSQRTQCLKKNYVDFYVLWMGEKRIYKKTAIGLPKDWMYILQGKEVSWYRILPLRRKIRKQA